MRLQNLFSQSLTFKAQEIIQTVICQGKWQLLSHLQLVKTFTNVIADTLKTRRQINLDILLVNRKIKHTSNL